MAYLKPPTPLQLRKLLGIASYQFGKDAGAALFDSRIRISCSRRTGRIRHIYKHGKLIATLKPKDGYLALTPEGAQRILPKMKRLSNLVVVQDDVAEFIQAGGDVFAKHVVSADERLRPAEEAIVTNEKNKLLGVGKAVLSGNDMKYLKRGVAIRIRRGTNESAETSEPLLSS